MKHRAKNGDWAERKRIWRHPLLGERLHHVIMGFITIKKVWDQREHWAHVEPHDRAYLVYEYVTDTGMRYIDDGWHLLGQCQMADGSNINEYISRKRSNVRVYARFKDSPRKGPRTVKTTCGTGSQGESHKSREIERACR